jgi:hypothetical protein
MALEAFPYDAAAYLTTSEAIFYFLEAELEEKKPTYWPGGWPRLRERAEGSRS